VVSGTVVFEATTLVVVDSGSLDVVEVPELPAFDEEPSLLILMLSQLPDLSPYS